MKNEKQIEALSDDFFNRMTESEGFYEEDGRHGYTCGYRQAQQDMLNNSQKLNTSSECVKCADMSEKVEKLRAASKKAWRVLEDYRIVGDYDDIGCVSDAADDLQKALEETGE